MSADQFEKLETDLCKAVTRRRFADVERLVPLYCAAAEARAKALPHGDPAISQIARQVEEVLEWARLMLLTARAGTAAELRHVPFLTRYVGSPETPRETMRLDV